MRRIRGWTGLQTSVVALGLVAAASGVTRADPMTSTSTLLAYDTVGSSVGTTGVTSYTTDSNGVMTPTAVPTGPAISFVPLTGGAFMSPSSLSLGMFKADALAAGQSVTYNNTPFNIKFKVDGINGTPSVMADGTTPGFLPNGTPVDITGVLNGTLTGANQSTVSVKFNPPASAAFATSLYSNTLQISDNPLSIVPSMSNGGMTSAQAVLTTVLTPATPAPEPSTIVLFAVTTAGLGLRHRLRRGRAVG